MGIDIGHNIKSARNAAGLTQEELARKCGVATITIRQYESGKREPKYDTLERLADALDVPLEVLLGIGDSVKTELVPKEKQGQQEADHDKAVTVHKITRMPNGGYSVAFSLEPDKISVATLKGIFETCRETGISTDDLKRTLDGGTMADFISELSKIILDVDSYHRKQPETAPQSTLDSTEGKDTPPPPDAAETASQPSSPTSGGKDAPDGKNGSEGPPEGE